MTTLIIAHRLSTLKNANRIYVLDHGRVLQEGTYASLAAQPGLFQTMLRLQLATSEGAGA
jgi:ABC-type multidrug transport system fused ATPase/permease subunit